MLLPSKLRWGATWMSTAADSKEGSQGGVLERGEAPVSNQSLTDCLRTFRGDVVAEQTAMGGDSDVNGW